MNGNSGSVQTGPQLRTGPGLSESLARGGGEGAEDGSWGMQAWPGQSLEAPGSPAARLLTRSLLPGAPRGAP